MYHTKNIISTYNILPIKQYDRVQYLIVLLIYDKIILFVGLHVQYVSYIGPCQMFCELVYVFVCVLLAHSGKIEWYNFNYPYGKYCQIAVAFISHITISHT